MILITTQCFPPDRGGIEILMGGLADSLAASGKDVIVFAYRMHEAAGEISAPYTIKRYGGFKPMRRRLKAWAVAKAAKSGRVATRRFGARRLLRFANATETDRQHQRP